MENLKSVGIEYISNRRVMEGDAVMFDIDDTLLDHSNAACGSAFHQGGASGRYVA